VIENFNYRHLQLQSEVKKSFRIVKHQFVILKGQMPYPFKIQAKIVITCFLLYNFIYQIDKDNVPKEIKLKEFTPLNLTSSGFPTTRQEGHTMLANQM
jgi:hypothetical protein